MSINYNDDFKCYEIWEKGDSERNITKSKIENWTKCWRMREISGRVYNDLV